MVTALVKVALVPTHKVSDGLTLIDTEGVRVGFTVMVMRLLVSVALLTHAIELINTQLITSLLAKALSL